MVVLGYTLREAIDVPLATRVAGRGWFATEFRHLRRLRGARRGNALCKIYLPNQRMTPKDTVIFRLIVMYEFIDRMIFLPRAAAADLSEKGPVQRSIGLGHLASFS